MKRSVLPILTVIGLIWAAFACASASAESSTVLCKANETPCKASNVYPKGTTVTFETQEASDWVEIATHVATIKCPSKLETTVGTSSGGTPLLSVSSWSLGNSSGYSSEWCTGLTSSGDCGTASGENLPYTVEFTNKYIEKISGGPSWHLTCEAGFENTYIDCTYYSKPKIILPYFTSDHKALQLSEYWIQQEGYACGGNESHLSGTFRIVEPEAPMYVISVEAPEATTGKPTHVKATSATLNGTVNPRGNATNYWFEYGKTEAYGSKTSTSSAGSGTSNVAVSKTISGLTVDTTYHYRLVAENEIGLETKGKDMTVGPPVFRDSFGSAGSKEDQFLQPAGIAVDPSGNVWVVDRTGSRIEKWSPSGEFLFAFGEKGSAEGQLKNPVGVAIDSEGNLWVTELGNSRIEEFSDGGEFLLAAGTEGEEEEKLKKPEGIAIDPEGDIWVVDYKRKALLEFDSEGNWKRTIYDGFERPTGIAIEPTIEENAFNMYIADEEANEVRQFSVEAGEYGETIGINEWGSAGSGNGQFNGPTTLAIDSEGNVWVGDYYNHRVQEFTAWGEYITQFETWPPGGLAADSSGNIWVADEKEFRVDRWSR